MSEIVFQPEAYFKRFVPEGDDLLKRLEAEALREDIPIVGPLMGNLLSLMVQITGAKKILELGTATGYSTIFLARAARKHKGTVTTLECDVEMTKRALANFQAAGLDQYIDIHLGDALKILETLPQTFDFVFLDIEKQDYLPALISCGQLIKPGGLLFADNVAFPDAQPFLEYIHDSDAWQPLSLLAFWPDHSPEKDAICLALRC
jgi:caffeoyl-CoA O-methyltransferase